MIISAGFIFWLLIGVTVIIFIMGIGFGQHWIESLTVSVVPAATFALMWFLFEVLV